MNLSNNYTLCIISIFLFCGCGDMNANQEIPNREDVFSISIYSIDENDNYDGVINIESKKLLHSLNDIGKIDKVYNLILSICAESSQIKEPMPDDLTIVIEFNNNSERIMLLWLHEDKIRILKQPISPKNISVIYQANIEDVQLIKKYLEII